MLSSVQIGRPYQSANHGNSDREAVPQAYEPDVAIDPAHSFRCTLTGYVRGYVSVC